MRALVALFLVGLFTASGPLFTSHLLQESAELTVRPVSPAQACQPGNGHGLVADHALQVKPPHLCLVCKVFNGALHVADGLTLPLWSASGDLVLPQSRKLHFAGFARLSRSPPSRA